MDIAQEVQEVTFENERPEDLILRYFLKEIARSVYGQHKTDLLQNPDNFKVFLKNFNYKPDSLVELIPLKPTASTPQITRAALKALIPRYEEALLLGNGDYLIYCDTIRGPFILSITHLALKDPVYADRFENWELGILDLKTFQKNLILRPDYFEKVKETPAFMKLLVGDQKPENSLLLSGLPLLNVIFFETRPKKGYGVSSITDEVQFFSSDQSLERELCFFSLPIVQFTLSGDTAKDFFFKITDPLLLTRIQSWLQPSPNFGAAVQSSVSPNSGAAAQSSVFPNSGAAAQSSVSPNSGTAVQSSLPTPLLSQIRKQFALSLEARRNSDFFAADFPDKLQKFLEGFPYSLNYDAIAQDKAGEVYDNVRNFILSQGIGNFEDLKKAPGVVEVVIRKFFVLGTTYFYRSWMTTREFKNHLGDACQSAEAQKRPLKFKVFACSTGEEVLTFAFELLEQGIDNFKIYGTDINLDFIESARRMFYKRESFERLPDALRERILKKYFTKTGEGYEIKDKPFFESRIRYDVLDITKPFPKSLPPEFSPPFDLISCQNIFLYLKPQVVPALYGSLFGLLHENGLFILVDKYYSHWTLKREAARYKALYVNDHLAKRLPDSTARVDILSRLKALNDKSPTFASIQQYDELSVLPFKERKEWLDALLKRPGNHSIIQSLVGVNLLNAKLHAEAIEVLQNAIYESPYLLNNYTLLMETHKQLSHLEEAQYLTLLLRAVHLLYDIGSSKSLQQALRMFQEAIYLRPRDPMGYYVLGYQLLMRGVALKSSNALLVDYEKFLNEAFKNLNYVADDLGGNKVFALRGIAEIATILHASYSREENYSIAERLIYNALFHFEPLASKSSEFTTLYNLGKLQMLMGPVYSARQDTAQACKYLKLGLKTFERAEAGLLNHRSSLLYDYYVDYARGWLLLRNLLAANPKMDPALEPMNCLHQAQKWVDTALMVNSVYGIEAIELRNQILEADPGLKQQFDATFET